MEVEFENIRGGFMEMGNSRVWGRYPGWEPGRFQKLSAKWSVNERWGDKHLAMGYGGGWLVVFVFLVG